MSSLTEGTTVLSSDQGHLAEIMENQRMRICPDVKNREIVSYSGSLFGTTFYQEPHYVEPHFSILYEDEMWFRVLKVLGMIWMQY